jgi:hypothetical protein
VATPNSASMKPRINGKFTACSEVDEGDGSCRLSGDSRERRLRKVGDRRPFPFGPGTRIGKNGLALLVRTKTHADRWRGSGPGGHAASIRPA